jgi:hypothetical protein
MHASIPFDIKKDRVRGISVLRGISVQDHGSSQLSAANLYCWENITAAVLSALSDE